MTRGETLSTIAVNPLRAFAFVPSVIAIFIASVLRAQLLVVRKLCARTRQVSVTV